MNPCSPERAGPATLDAKADRERLIEVKRSELSWADVDAWRKGFHRDFELALTQTKLPERPDYDLPRRCAGTAGAANRFLIKPRRERAKERPAR